MEAASKFILPGVIFLLTLASGFWLSRVGKPYNTAIFTIHKLIALMMVIMVSVQIYQLFKGAGTPMGAEIQAPTQIIALGILAGLCALALFVTGALMSIGKPSLAILLTIHQVAPYVGGGALGLMLYLLAGKAL